MNRCSMKCGLNPSNVGISLDMYLSCNFSTVDSSPQVDLVHIHTPDIGNLVE